MCHLDGHIDNIEELQVWYIHHLLGCLEAVLYFQYPV